MPSWEITQWQAFYEVRDWIGQGLGKENDINRGLAFAKAVQEIEEENHYKKTGRKIR